MRANTMTFVFTDVVGSTALTSRLGDRAVDELLIHLGVLRDVVATTGGREVKNVGDGLMLAFRSATDAVSCAVAMQQATHRQNERPGAVPLGLRVGVHAGDAIPADGDYFGTPVNAAKRLCDRASGGQILASRLVCDLVGPVAGHRFRDLGDLTLKGILGPVASCDVVWEPVSTRPGPLPRFVAARESSPFVGRGDELAALSAEFERVCANECRLVLVDGEPGIGKTRVTAEFCADVHQRGAQILLGQCTDETLVPYQPFIEAISRYVSNCRLEALRLDLADTGGELRRLAPELAERLPDLPEPVRGDPAGERHRLYGSVARLLVNIAASAPLVLVIEDVHRADRATLALLAHVVRTLRDVPLLILCTCRGTEVDRSEALAATLADLQRDQLFERLPLAGLDEQHVADLVDVIAGLGAPPQLARDLHDRTDGNPFFIEEVLRHLRETGALRTDTGLDTAVVTLAQHAIPTGVKDVIGQRLAQLGPEAVKVLTLASVIGPEFDVGLLGAVGVSAEDDVLELLEHAVRAGLIAEVPETVGRFAYGHALIREALYDDLTRTRRVHLHREIAVALERQCGDDPGPRLRELAYHFLQAAPAGDVDTAVTYATSAAERAISRAAYEEAALSYAAAVGVLEEQGEDDTARYVELLLGLGDSQRLVGDPAAARETFGRAAGVARAHGWHRLLADAARGYTAWTHAYALRAQPDDSGAELIEAALGHLGEDDDSLRATLLAQLAFARYFDRAPDGERSRRSGAGVAGPAGDALDLARRTGDPAALGAALHAQMYAVAGLDPGAALSIAVEMLEIGERGEDWELVLWARSWRVLHFLMIGDLEGFAAEASAFGSLADRLRVPIYRWFSARWRCVRAIVEGRLDDAERLAFDAFEAAKAGQQEEAGALHLAAQFAVIRGMQGRGDELAIAIEAAIEQHEALPTWRCALAALYADLDREPDARATFEELAVDDFALLPRDWDWLVAAQNLVQACTYLRDERRAAVLYEQLEPFAGYLACSGWATVCVGSVSACLGNLASVLERWDDSARHFGEAMRQCATLDARPFLAQTQLDFASMLLRRGEAVDALDLAEQAHAGAERIGMARLVRVATDLKREAEAVLLPVQDAPGDPEVRPS
jgi:class 3 adenylate cyclase